ncbi:hypothetical protein ACIGW8_27115 [Streptomyces sioyaensis]|uniref:hypothetical protein n=1 Tax=Streptomyces sioyaensis TaxID=67364 RepID=UPI0037D18623
MVIHLEDRWFRQLHDAAHRVRTRHYGKAPRYRAHFIGTGGTRNTKSFRSRRDAERWLVRTEVAHLLDGEA